MTVDYTHILSFYPIIYRRKRSDSTPSLVYGVKIPSLSCWYSAYDVWERPHWVGTSDLMYLQQRSFATQKWHLSNCCLMQVMHSPVLLFPSPKWAW